MLIRHRLIARSTHPKKVERSIPRKHHLALLIRSQSLYQLPIFLFLIVQQHLRTRYRMPALRIDHHHFAILTRQPARQRLQLTHINQ